MKSVYIHSAACISAQPTFESEDWLLEMVKISGKKVEALPPNYKDYISPMALRRMATGVKMGVAAAGKALQLANIAQPDAILTGTGMGCIEDTEKFLNNIIANEEDFLTPTSFIQSTHNTVGAQIALGLQCHAYNSTYVHGAVSFESALLDAQLLIQQEEATTILVGGVDELGTEFVDAVRMLEDQTPNGIKVPIGEGASFFVISSEPTNKGVQLLDVQTFSALEVDSMADTLHSILKANQLSASDVDVLITGNNGDGYDHYYEHAVNCFSEHTTQLTYKEWSGEFYTASAFGLFLAYHVLKLQQIPSALLQHHRFKSSIKTILLYNQFKGRNHSIILLQSC